jgi:hypothetical protein
VEAMSKKQELIDRVLNDLDNNWVVSKQDILALIDFLTEAQVNKQIVLDDNQIELVADIFSESLDLIADNKNIKWWITHSFIRGAKFYRSFTPKEDTGNKELIDNIINR